MLYGLKKIKKGSAIKKIRILNRNEMNLMKWTSWNEILNRNVALQWNEQIFQIMASSVYNMALAS